MRYETIINRIKTTCNDATPSNCKTLSNCLTVDNNKIELHYYNNYCILIKQNDKLLNLKTLTATVKKLIHDSGIKLALLPKQYAQEFLHL